MSKAGYYTMKIAGLERDLPICPVNEKLSIAGFIMFSDVELTVAVASELLKKVPEFDVILTAESKGIPLAYEMARQSGKNYFVARKGKKLYMKNPAEVTVQSITTVGEQKLYLSDDDMALIEGKRVLIVDDVISTGESLRALQKLVEVAGGKEAALETVLAEGEAADRKDIIYLEPLPLFFK
jgi:adenine phosphoribosyltransferase